MCVSTQSGGDPAQRLWAPSNWLETWIEQKRQRKGNFYPLYSGTGTLFFCPLFSSAFELWDLYQCPPVFSGLLPRCESYTIGPSLSEALEPGQADYQGLQLLDNSSQDFLSSITILANCPVFISFSTVVTKRHNQNNCKEENFIWGLRVSEFSVLGQQGLR